jgi:hypothetical protein
MSEVISFRLNNTNSREAQAREVIEVWVKQGYSLQHILTEALLRLGNQEDHSRSSQLGDISETIEHLASLVGRLEAKQEIVQPEHQAKSELSEFFLSSIKLAVKPEMRVND